jgi:hypothetical protein
LSICLDHSSELILKPGSTLGVGNPADGSELFEVAATGTLVALVVAVRDLIMKTTASATITTSSAIAAM